jgi:hypothetical protein
MFFFPGYIEKIAVKTINWIFFAHQESHLAMDGP